MKKAVVAILSLVVYLSACRSGDKKTEPTAGTFLYGDYKVWGEENSEAVTIRMQFRRGGRNGNTVVLVTPAKVHLDGEVLTPDSVGKIGAFYEVQKRLDEFTGLHTIHFWDEKGNLYKEEFRFEPFSVETLPAAVSRENLGIVLNNLGDSALLHLILTDTSFNSNDINQIDTVTNGQLVVPEEKLLSLVNGPISLQLIHNRDKFIRKEGKRIGQLSISYSLQREFILQD